MVKQLSTQKALLWLGILAVSACSNESDHEQDNNEAKEEIEQQRGALTAAIPGARAVDDGGVSRAFGTALATGRTHAQAAESFVRAHSLALGANPSDLRPAEVVDGRVEINSAAQPLGLMLDRSTGQYKFYLYRYAQVRDGVPVHDSQLLALVRNAGDHPVVWSSSSLRSVGSFRASPTLAAKAPDTAKILRALEPMTDFTGRRFGSSSRVTSVTSPELRVFAGRGATAVAPAMASTFIAETADPPGKWRVVTDAATGDVLDVESLIVFEDVVGSVSGNVTEGAKSMDCAEEVPTAFPLADVFISGGDTATAGLDGQFVIPNPGTDPVDVTSQIGGVYFDVTDYSGANEVLTSTVTPPGPIDFLHNPENLTDDLRAQSNGYVHAMIVRDFLLSYVPDYPTISTQVDFPVSVNRTDLYCPGNAWYDYSSINFCRSSSQYGNTSFASVNHHEYGHHIVSSGGSGQGPYGEGMSDVVALLIAEDPGLGYGFFLNQCDSPLRTADNDCQYSATSCSSCGSSSHACGNLISGVVWDIREQLLITEPTEYADILSTLMLSSIPMHTGTSINESIAIDLLTLDDDDGLLDNGTPHYAEICAGFAAHGMSCPPILEGMAVAPDAVAEAEGPNGGPFAPATFVYEVTNLGPEASLDYAVSIEGSPSWVQVVDGSGSVLLNETASVTVQIDQAAAAGLSNGAYAANVLFDNTTNGVGNTTRVVELDVGVPLAIYSEDFEDGLGDFTIGGESNNLWHLTTSCASTLTTGHSAPSSLYFGNDSTCNFNSGLVAGTVTSPVVAVTDTSLLLLRLNYFLQTENSNSYDRASVAVSVNGGTFVTLATNYGIGTDLPEGTGVWEQAELDLSSLVSSLPSADVQIRFAFDSVDSVANTYAGFLVDDVELRAFGATCSTDADCDDGLSCSGAETCVNGACQAGQPVDCDDAVACTVDSCDELSSCVNTPNDSACDDGNVCSGTETCDPASGCVAGTPLECDDGDPCTNDSCDPVLGCFVSPVSCDDGDACTADVCDPVTGCSSSPISCDDGDPCTVSSCDSETGCATTPVDCDDGDPCTVDSCDAATGCSSVALDCDDGNECTADSCDAVLGCVNEPITGTCSDDGNECTDDVCDAGQCTHPDNGSCGPGVFLESGGTVVMEAENFHEHIARANHNWTPASNGSASGGQLLVANPNTNTNINTGYVSGSPELRYEVNFQTTGTYYVWVRGIGQSGDDDSCHVGIDGTGPSSADRISSFATNLSWSRSTMDGPVATINVNSAGVHTISLWMREDGFRFDKLLLTTNGNYFPSGLGPNESPQGIPEPECASNADCNDSNACTNDACISGSCSYTNNSDPCADDGNSCTDDICSGGTCTHPDNGTCQPTSPCAAYCSNPVPFSGNFQSGSLGSGATCHETTSPLNGGVCGNFANGRSLYVNGQQMSCTGNWPSLPPPVNGGYCVWTTAGQYPWAYFATW